MLAMPAHKDVPEGFLLLKSRFSFDDIDELAIGWRHALGRAGLHHFIERQFSVDSVRRFKLAPEVYISSLNS